VRAEVEFRRALIPPIPVEKDRRLGEAALVLPERPVLAGPGIYFVQEQGEGFIKIGYASSIADRFRTLQTGSPRKLRMLGAVPGGPGNEFALHVRFKAMRFRAEWFWPQGELLAFIGALPELTDRDLRDWSPPE
jgi:hypothetical protein